MLNKLVLDQDSLVDLEKRKAVRRKLAKQILLDTTFLKVERFLLRAMLLFLLIFAISHYMTFGHFGILHTHG